MKMLRRSIEGVCVISSASRPSQQGLGQYVEVGLGLKEREKVLNTRSKLVN